MSQPATMPDIHNVSRDPADLTNYGSFIHRRLAESLQEVGVAVWASAKDMTAFITATPADRAQILSTKLKEFDARNGGIGAAASPAPMVVVQQPATVAQPQAQEPAKRQPRTTGHEAPSSPAATPTTPAAGALELLSVIKRLEGHIEDVLSKQTKLAGGLEVAFAEIQRDIAELKVVTSAVMQIVEGVDRKTELSLGLLCLFGQQVLGNVPLSEILPVAASDAKVALEFLAQSGKD